MHLMCAEDARISERVGAIIKSIDQVYLEVDLDNAAELLSGMLELRKSNGKNLRSVLDEPDYVKVKTFFEKYQPAIPFSVIELQPPLMISSSLYEILLPCEQKNGVELKIIEEAYKQKKETKGLETIAFQASIFDSIPYELQAKELVSSIENLENNRSSMNEMITAYKEQDIEKLYNLSVQEQGGLGNYLDLLLYRRNRDWVEKFAGIVREGPALFAVGAGHLGGDQGVLNLLKEEGYSVRPIANE